MSERSGSMAGPIALFSAVAIVGVTAGAILGGALYRANLPAPIEIAQREIGQTPIVAEVPATEPAEPIEPTQARVVEPEEPAMTVAERTPPVSPQTDRFDAPPTPPAMIAEPDPQVAASAPATAAAPVPANRPLPPEAVSAQALGVDPFALLLLPPSVEVAETEAEAVAIEERLSSVGTAYFELPPEGDAVAIDGEAVQANLGAARVTDYVNLRAGPNSETDVLTVVPLNGEILVEPECTGWCEVVYDGQSGYIFDRFIEREDG